MTEFMTQTLQKQFPLTENFTVYYSFMEHFSIIKLGFSLFWPAVFPGLLCSHGASLKTVRSDETLEYRTCICHTTCCSQGE